MDADLCIAVGEQTIPVVIKRHKKARNLRLRLNYRNQVAVSAPWHCSNRKALSFVEKHYEWLAQQVASVPGVQTIYQWLTRNRHLSAHGDRFKIYMESSPPTPGTAYQIDSERKNVVFRVPENHPTADSCLQRLVRSFAKDVITCRCEYHALRLNLKVNKLSIRDQVSRWGSCSASGNISLNWRLVLIGPELQDYVILHELAHLNEMNHSVRFWTLLDQYDPQRVVHENALKTVTAEMMRVGR